MLPFYTTPRRRPPEISDETSLVYPGWRVAAACFVIAVCSWSFGFYGQGVYLAALEQQQHWNVALISGASTTYYLFSAVLVLFVGDAIARFGPRCVILFGTTCLAVSTVLVGYVDTPWQLYADYGLMSFGWATMSVASISTIVGAWFDKRRGLAISLALTGASVGGIATTPLLVMLVERFGLKSALFDSVTVMVVLLAAVVHWLRTPAHGSPKAEHSGSSSADAKVSWTRRRALKDLGFWTVSSATALVLFTQVGFLVHQIAFLSPRIGRTAAGVGVAMTAGFAVIGRLSLGSIVDRLDPRWVSAVSYLSQAVAIVVIIGTMNATVLLTACAVYGFSVGNVLVLPSLIIQQEFAARAFPMLISLSLAIAQFVYALGPGTLGLLRNVTGSYHLPLALCAALELAAVGLILVRGESHRSG